LLIRFIAHFQIVTTTNYSAIANSHNLQFIRAHTKSSQFALTSPFLVMNPNNVLCLRPYWLENVSQLIKLTKSQSQGQIYFTTGGLRPKVCLGTKPLGTHDQNFSFQLSPCGHSPPTRGRVRHLQLLLVLASRIRSPAGLMTIFYCLRFQTTPTWRARSPYLYPPGTGWPSYTPRHWVSFSSQSYGAGIRTRLHAGLN
jgi:hypothetical protein